MNLHLSQTATRVRMVFQILTLISAWMATPLSNAASGEKEMETIKLTEQNLAQAVLKGDTEFLDKTYAEDFKFTHSTGMIHTKEGWINFLKEGSVKGLERSVDSIEVELHGDIAVTTGRIHSKTDSSNPRWQEYTIWYIRVYAKRDNRWQLLCHRSIREKTGPLPGPEEQE